MNRDRRLVLAALGTSAVAGNEIWRRRSSSGNHVFDYEAKSPVHALIPVIGDGKWISTAPPEDSTGLLETRAFELSVEIEMDGLGNAQGISASTAAPVAFPEQQIESVRVERNGCRAGLQQLTPTAGRLVLQADSIRRGQRVSAAAKYRLQISKSYFGYDPEMFPVHANQPRSARAFLGDSPGIKSSSSEVRKVAKAVRGDAKHPWVLAQRFRDWVWENIEGRYQDYTDVVTALRKRVGDCEERAAVFVALCRSCDIPARLVWVPNHNWAEIMLVDESGEEHWIPVHTAAYSWFGWTGVHELVLQKGDRIPIPGKAPVRLIHDHVRCSGKRPEVRFKASLTPVAQSSEDDPGPGARQKHADGQWKLVGDHEDQRWMRK
ncbi:MAG: transglutaminase-like domain-containing protein [Planctomycetota bacterium]